MTTQRRQRVQAQDNVLYGPTGEPLVPSPASVGRQALTHGGVTNDLAGLGGTADKSQQTYFSPTRFHNRYPLEIIYIQSWAAAHFVDIPVDDMWVRGREWEDENEESLDRLNEEEMMLEVNERLAGAMKAARLYGTGLAMMMTNEAPADTELNVDMIREGDLTNILVLDRYSVRPRDWVLDPYNPQYGKPMYYDATLEGGVEISFHHSRVLRFDGRKSITSEGWTGFYERDWGISELLYAITEIIHDAALAANISQLSYEASIPVVKSEGFRDVITGGGTADDPSVATLGSRINLYKSLYRIMFMDINDSFERVNVTFAGIADLMDQYWKRLAAIAKIPATRFLGRSPEGMNATGDSDSANYAMSVKSMQERLLKRPLTLLDKVVARHLGMMAPLKYTWRPLTDMSDKDQAEVSRTRAEALAIAYDRNALTEDEFRERLSGDELFGQLGPMPDELAERIEMQNQPPVLPSELDPNAPPMNGGEDDDA